MFKSLKDTSGLSIVATILALLIFSLFIAVAVSLVTTGAYIGVQETQGQQAFDIADGGLHYTLALNKLNIPNYSTHGQWIPLGAGQFRVDTPAYLTSNYNKTTDSVITVDSTTRFPSTGRLAIGTDFKITYNATTASTFTVVAKGESHSQNDSVYPAAKLTDTLLANCTALPTINVSDDLGTGNDIGFDIRRPFFIDTEYFYCTGKTANQFQNCTRCYLGSLPTLHNPSTYAAQYILTSTGRITNFLSNTVQRVVQISAGQWEE
ncbi:MAG: hypothetical protein WC855_14585 [Thermodesulfovibrionales bacterium]